MKWNGIMNEWMNEWYDRNEWKGVTNQLETKIFTKFERLLIVNIIQKLAELTFSPDTLKKDIEREMDGLPITSMTKYEKIIF